jgi:hypothetical protein
VARPSSATCRLGRRAARTQRARLLRRIAGAAARQAPLQHRYDRLGERHLDAQSAGPRQHGGAL